jgi:hypothetical protein
MAARMSVFVCKNERSWLDFDASLNGVVQRSIFLRLRTCCLHLYDNLVAGISAAITSCVAGMLSEMFCNSSGVERTIKLRRRFLLFSLSSC